MMRVTSTPCRLPLLAWLIALTLLVLPAAARAELAVTFMPIEEAKYLVKGADWGGAREVEVVVDYDTTYLTHPEATAMGGTLLHREQLDTTPGRVRLTLRNDGLSPGFEICLFFRKEGDFPAVINFVTAEGVSARGRRVPVTVTMRPNPNTTAPSGAAPRTTNHGGGDR